jgi:hypothetical protein
MTNIFQRVETTNQRVKLPEGINQPGIGGEWDAIRWTMENLSDQ